MAVYCTYVPGAPLATFVEQFWLCEDETLPQRKERRLPDGAMELVVNLREDRVRLYDRERPERFQSLRGGVVSGAHSAYSIIDTACQMACIGVHFRPGGAFPFFSLPAGELQDTCVSLDVLWGVSAHDLRDRLLAAPAPEAKFRILEQSLVAQMREAPLSHPAVAFALSAFRRVPHELMIADVAEETGLSQRRFIEVFRKEVGLSPKLFCRIRRFQAALLHIKRGQQVDWTEIAIGCGYFDQAHFIHDFRAFSGLNPAAYLARQGEHLNHVLL